jgi:hypothetical protein
MTRVDELPRLSYGIASRKILAPGEVKHAGGRPSKYDPAYCDKVIKWGKLGKSKTWMLAEIGIVDQTFRNWEAEHSEFLEAMELAMRFSQQWWEDAGQNGMKSADKFSAPIWSRSMSARFPAEWRENSNVNLGGQPGNPVQVTGVEITVLGSRPKA